MKKRNSFVTALLLLIIISMACNYQNQRTRTVKINNEDISVKIEYCGDIIFNDDETAIEEISPDGYVKYKKNGKRFIAESDEDGNISYKLYDGNMDLNYHDAEAREFIERTVREIAEHYDR